MIVKIENSDKNGYFYYEGNEIKYASIPMQKAKAQYKDEDVDWIIGGGHEKREELWVTAIHIFKKSRLECTMIIATTNIFILNNDGKTIDRLY